MAQKGTPLGNMIINLSMDGSQFTDSLAGVRQQIKLAESAMKSNLAVLGDSGDEYQKLGAKINGLKTIISGQNKQLEILKKNHQKAIEQYGEGSRQATNYGLQINRLVTKMSGYKNQLQNAERALDGLNNGQQKSITKSAKFGKALDGVKAKLDEISEKASQTGDRLQAILSVGGLAGGAGLISMSADVSDSMTKLENSLGLTGKQTKVVKEQVRSLWRDGFGQDMNSVAEALIQVRQNIHGLSSGDVKNVTKDSLLLAETFDSDVNEVTRAGGQLMKTFGINSQEAYDLMAAGGQKGLNFSKEMFDNLSEYSPLFGKMGYSAEEYFGLLQRGSKAGVYNLDYINDIMKEFQIRSKDGSKGVSDAMGQLSEKTQNVWKNYQNGKGTVKDVASAVTNDLKGMKDQTQANQIGVELFGTKWEDMESDAVYAMLGTNKAMEGTKGKMKEMSKTAEQSFGQKWRQTLRKLQDAILPVADTLLDTANEVLPPLIKKLGEISKWFNSLPKDVKVFTVGLGAAMLVAGPLVLIFGRIIMTIAGFSKAIIGVVKWIGKFKWITTALRATIAGITSPIGLWVLAISAVIAGLVFAYKHSETFRNAVNKLGQKIKEGIKWIGQFAKAIKAIWTGDKNGGGTKILKHLGMEPKTISKIKTTVATIKRVFDNFKDGIVLIFKGIWKIIKGIWNTLIGFLSGDSKKLSKGLKGIFSGLGDTLKGIFKTSILGTLTAIFSKAVEKLKKLALNGFDKIVKFAKDMPGKMAKGIRAGATAVKNAAKSIGNGIMSGIEWGVNKAIGGVNWVLSKLGSDKKIATWSAPKYAKGTGKHPGGPAWVGDGGEHELIRTPDGQVGISPKKATLVNLPKGTEVLSGSKTKKLLNMPAYATGSGGWLSNAVDSVKGFGSAAFNKVKDWSSEIWDWVSSKTKIGSLLSNRIGAISSKFSNGARFMAEGGVHQAIEAAKNMLFNEAETSGPTGPSGPGAAAWAATIKRAAAFMKVSLSDAELKGIIAQIHRESGGNQKIIQSSAVVDVNTLNGNPARGLLQYIPQTFRAYAMKGHGNILSGYDQLLAFFNNSTWRKDLPYGRSGWGPKGGRRFANGGLITSRIDGATLGEDGSEVVIPLSSAKRTRALQLLQQAANRMGASVINGRNNNNNSQGSQGQSNQEALLQEQNNLLKQQVQLLTALLSKNNDVYLDGKSLYESNQRYEKAQTKKRNIARGLV